jgi:5-methylcytosine-specific restriction protein B
MAKEVISKDLLESLKEEIKTALKFQRQVILYGPPGTGKTYLAKKVAEEFSKENKLILLLRKYWSEFVQDISGTIKKFFLFYKE